MPLLARPLQPQEGLEAAAKVSTTGLCLLMPHYGRWDARIPFGRGPCADVIGNINKSSWPYFIRQALSA